VLCFLEDAFGGYYDVPTTVFDMSAKHKFANASCMAMAMCILKFWDVTAFVITGASSDPESFRWVRRKADMADAEVVDVFNDLEEDGFGSLEDLYAAAKEHSATRPVYICTNCGAGSVTFVVDRAITHIIPGSLTFTTDLNPMLQVRLGFGQGLRFVRVGSGFSHFST
jgi:hypothetical protein